MSEFGGTPLVLGSVRGYRGWSVRDGHLYPVNYIGLHGHVDTQWTPGENVAHCEMHDWYRRLEPLGMVTASGRYTSVAHPDCSCGFYSYWRFGHQAFTAPVRGIVEGYGKVTMGTKGMRAEKARIVALQLPSYWLPTPLQAMVFTGAGCSLFALLYQILTVGIAELSWVHFTGAALNLATVFLCLIGFNSTRFGWNGNKDWVDRIRQNYPGIPVYKTVTMMKAKHLWPYAKARRRLMNDVP